MPGGDRTGPEGMGPMTGRAAGYCAGYPTPGYMNPVGGRGLGRGRGRGMGRGMGRGFRAGFAQAPVQQPAVELTKDDELEMLRRQIDVMTQQMQQIQQQLNNLKD